MPFLFAIFAMFWNEILDSVGEDDQIYILGVFVVNIYLSRTGNKKVGKYWIKKGFVFLEPASDAAHLAKSKFQCNTMVSQLLVHLVL